MVVFSCLILGGLHVANEWIIDVLTDLRRFAKRNGLAATAAELEDACLVALAELAEGQARETGQTIDHEGETGEPSQLLAESDVA